MSVYNTSSTSCFLMSPDKEEALYMGVWDRFKDCFRTHKKQEVLEVLYTLIHGCE
ncbi:hypothetical protein DP140_26840, partial [Salmonella enterica subsp. enterica serovar Weltevreden]